MKVKTDKGIFEGVLTSAGAFSDDFHLDIGDESVKIHCNKIIDIIPIKT